MSVHRPDGTAAAVADPRAAAEAARPAPARAGRPAPRAAWALAAAMLAVGAGLRVARFLDARPLWLDEALIALNVLDPPPGGLLGRLSFAQGAPPAFLWAEAGLVGLLGPGERVLRLAPLLAALAALAVAWPVARRLAAPRAAPAALALLAVLAPLIYYSAEAKQYSSDVLAALAVTGASLLVLERPRDGRRALAAGLVGAVAVWVSHAAPLVLAGSTSVLAVRAARHRDVVAVRRLAGATALWIGSLAGAWALSLRHLAGLRHHVLAEDSPFALPFPPRSAADLARPAEAGAALLRDVAGWPAPLAAAAAALAALGAVAMLRRDAARAALLLAPAGAAVAAAALGAYPLGGRFALFLLPALAILIAEGTVALAGRAAGRSLRRALAVLPFAALIGWQAWLAGAQTADPRLREDIRPALVELTQAARPGDRLYVSHGAQYALRYYAESGWIRRAAGRPLPWRLAPAPADPRPAAPALLGRPPGLVVGRSVRGGAAAGIAADLAALAGGARTWVLVSHAIKGDEAFLRARFDAAGRRLRSSRHEGAALYLYDLRRGGA